MENLPTEPLNMAAHRPTAPFFLAEVKPFDSLCVPSTTPRKVSSRNCGYVSEPRKFMATRETFGIDGKLENVWEPTYAWLVVDPSSKENCRRTGGTRFATIAISRVNWRNFDGIGIYKLIQTRNGTFHANTRWCLIYETNKTRSLLAVSRKL